MLKTQFQPHEDQDPIFSGEIKRKLEEPLLLSVFKDFVTPAQVRNAINRSPTKKSPGHDGITRPLLKALPRKSIVLLTQIYNGILRTTHIPHSWKHARIVMIKKPNKPQNDPTSYRPISLLPLLAKILERILLPKLMHYLGELIPSTQFGFREMHSCPQQLHRVVEQILETFEQRQECLGAFLDTEKAFDKVWHPGLLSKVKPHLPDTYYRILLSYLSGRTFSVGCLGAVSSSALIESSVPQGSILGPLLYLIYTSDFPTSDQLTLAQYADDVAALCRADDPMRAEETLQEFMRLVERWCLKWRVVMNVGKSALINFTLRRRRTISTTVILNGEPIPVVESVRYLGLTLDKKLTWKEHIEQLVRRMRHRISQLKSLLGRTSSLSLDTKRLIYLSLIRPMWMYSCGIWGAAAKTHLNRIQTTQNRILRLITDAPWYVRNSTLHTDLDIPEVNCVLRSAYSNLHSSMREHTNTLLVDLSNSGPPPPNQRRLKRKRPQDFL